MNSDFKNNNAPGNDELWWLFRAEISHMRPIQARKLKLLKSDFDPQMTPTAATARRQLSHLAKALAHSAQG